jgi:hypothetical protein
MTPFIFTPTGPVTSFQFPDDADAGKAKFLSMLQTPAELWLRCYAVTMPEVSDALIAAHQAGYARHVTVDHSEMTDTAQATLVRGLATAGLEVTICTSYAGPDYISHEKTLADAGGNVFTGSTNWSESAWDQLNKSLVFNSPSFVAQLVASFHESVQYAWTSERGMQILYEPPASYVPPA